MERGIKNQFSIRNQRPKGYFKIFKVTVITIICFWLLYQISKSLNNKKDERPFLQGKVDEALGLLRNFDRELDSDIFGRKGNAGRSKEEAFSENDQLDSEGKNIGKYGAGDDEIDGFVDAGSVFSQKRNKNEKVEVDKRKRAEDYELGIVVQKQNDQKREESYELVHENQKAQTNYVGKKHKEEDPKENWKSIESLKTTNDNVKQEQDEETSLSMEKEEGSVKKEPIIDEVQGFDDVTGVSQDGNDLFLTGLRDDFSSNFRRELVSNDSVEHGNIDDQNSANEGKGSNKEEEGISDSDVEITKTKSSVQDSKIETADAYTKVESN